MRSVSITALLFAWLIPLTLAAQTLTPGEFAPQIAKERGFAPAAPLAFLDRWKVLIRRSFASRLEEQKPAALSYDSAGDGGTTSDIHVALGRYFKTRSLNLAPFVEWQRSQQHKTDKRRVSAGASLDYQLRAVGAVVPFVRADSLVARDSVRGLTTSLMSIALSGYKDEELGGSAILRKDILVGTYYPYLGVELLHNQPFATQKVANVNVAVSSFEAKWYPGNTSPDKVNAPGELAMTFSFRHASGDSAVRGNYRLFVLDSNLYLDQSRRVSVGATYRHGGDPESDFTHGHGVSIALRLKI